MSATATQTSPARKTCRDARIDHIGFVNELDKHFAGPINDAVKLKLVADNIDLAEGDFFQGLYKPGHRSALDVEKFLRLYDKGKITREQFKSILTIRRDPATKFLTGDQLAAMSFALPPAPSLTVSRKKNVELPLVEVIKALGPLIK